MATDAEHVARLRSIRDNLAADLDRRTAEWAAAGSPPTYSVNGRSFQWDSWLSTRLKELADLDEKIKLYDTPVEIHGRAYTI